MSNEEEEGEQQQNNERDSSSSSAYERERDDTSVQHEASPFFFTAALFCVCELREKGEVPLPKSCIFVSCETSVENSTFLSIHHKLHTE